MLYIFFVLLVLSYVTNLFILWCVGKMVDVSDVESVWHVSSSFSDSEGSDSLFLEDEICMSPIFSEMDEVSRELSEFARMYEPPSLSEEEDMDLYPWRRGL